MREDGTGKRLIVVVDDEPDIRDLVRLHLERGGFQVECFGDAESFLSFLEKNLPELVILDLMLPDIHGTEVCRMLRDGDRTSALPMIMLTALGEEADRVLGLELGADDYVSKPFSPRELVSRVKAVLRRGGRLEEAGSIMRAGARIALDVERFETNVDGRKVNLTPTEFRILRTLAEGKGRVYSRKRLLEILWEGEKIVFERTIDVHIRNLRKKLGDAGEAIKNVRGIGYKLET
ncbi:response regulator [Candidatus Fermentibacteria bacterium]|nr:response regulator [Candidatus Fermentibacteria bacterium]